MSALDICPGCGEETERTHWRYDTTLRRTVHVDLPGQPCLGHPPHPAHGTCPGKQPEEYEPRPDLSEPHERAPW